MRKGSDSSDMVLAPEAADVATATRLLRNAVERESAEASDREIDHFLSRATESTELTEAAFAAIQTLRDLATLDHAEAAWLCGELFDGRLESYVDHDPTLRRAEKLHIDAYVRHARASGNQKAACLPVLEATEAAYHARESEAKAAFHRARGEERLAEMILADPEAYAELCAEGEFRLIDEKRLYPSPVMGTADPKKAALIAERILAYGSLEAPEMFRQCSMINDTAPPEDAASAIAAVQNLRSLGAISEAEAAYLVDNSLAGTFMKAWGADRECVRLRREMEAIDRANAAPVRRWIGDGHEPFEWKVLNAEFERRATRLMAFWLRRYGEHRLANLVLERPDEYHQLVDEGMRRAGAGAL